MAAATNTVDQSRLVLNAFAAYFQNNLLAADLVTWNQFSGEMNDRNALQVSQQTGPHYVVTQTTQGINDLSGGVQNSVFGSEVFTVKDVFGASMGWMDFTAIKDMGDARRSEALKRAAVSLAETIDAYILKTCQFAANNEVGTAGNNIGTFADVATAYTRFKKEGVDDSDLRAVLTYDDLQALGTTVVGLAAPDNLVTNTFRQGFNGSVMGIPTMYTQQLSNITPGTRTNGTVSGANQNVNYKDVCISTTNGQYLTQTINLAGLGAAGTVKDGEVFTIANVFAYDNRLHQTHSHLQQFRVVGNYTADGAGALASCRIFPAIIIDDGTSTTGDNAVNRAHATVGSIPANGAAVTWRGTASTAYKPRIIMKKSAIICNTADLIMPATGEASRVALTKVPLSVRMWKDSTFSTGEHRVRFDVAVTANTQERRQIVRLNGA
jgi:hypothetical protein